MHRKNWQAGARVSPALSGARLTSLRILKKSPISLDCPFIILLLAMCSTIHCEIWYYAETCPSSGTKKPKEQANQMLIWLVWTSTWLPSSSVWEYSDLAWYIAYVLWLDTHGLSPTVQAQMWLSHLRIYFSFSWVYCCSLLKRPRSQNIKTTFAIYFLKTWPVGSVNGCVEAGGGRGSVVGPYEQ